MSMLICGIVADREGSSTPCPHRSICWCWGKVTPKPGISFEKRSRTTCRRRLRKIDRRAGSNWQILCDSRWADEGVFDWGVLEYPDIDAYRVKVAELEKLNFWRYWSSNTILGTKMDVPSP